jgi:HAD superfamily hydrolase (TIGR01484 family)
MKMLAEFKSPKIKVLFTDIDDTLTNHGQLHAGPYAALWNLAASGILVIPVTGRPAGWCEMIARFWPVHGVIGENGGFYFRYIEQERRMHRHFVFSENERNLNRLKLEKIRDDVLQEVPDCAIASDQFSRLMDLAVDFSEDVGPLAENDILRITKIFEKYGAQAKVSSIHVNGWFGSYDKLTMCKTYLRKELDLDIDVNQNNELIGFSGDSPNDEPMFAFFKNSFAVANIRRFLPQLTSPPAFVTNGEGGDGFMQIAEHLISLRALHLQK